MLVPQCFWCHKAKSDVQVLDSFHMDEPIEQVVMDYEPCVDCAKGMSQGIIFIEASMTPLKEGQPSIQEDVYPTGRVAVLVEDKAKLLLTPGPHCEQVLRDRRTFMDVKTFEQHFGDVLKGR